MNWRLYLQGGGAFLLQILLIQALLRRGGKQYVLLTLYAVTLFLGTVMNLSILLETAGEWSSAAQQYYWTTEVLQHVFVFSAIIGFIYQRMGRSESQARWGRWLVVAAALGVILTFWIHRNPRLSLWMTSVTRDLSFMATILNFILWGVLLRDPRRNRRMLLVSGGLGVQLAGQAVGHGFRLLSDYLKSLLWLGNVILLATYFLSLIILWRAFSRAEQAPS